MTNYEVGLFRSRAATDLVAGRIRPHLTDQYLARIVVSNRLVSPHRLRHDKKHDSGRVRNPRNGGNDETNRHSFVAIGGHGDPRHRVCAGSPQPATRTTTARAGPRCRRARTRRPRPTPDGARHDGQPHDGQMGGSMMGAGQMTGAAMPAANPNFIGEPMGTSAAMQNGELDLVDYCGAGCTSCGGGDLRPRRGRTCTVNADRAVPAGRRQRRLRQRRLVWPRFARWWCRWW